MKNIFSNITLCVVDCFNYGGAVASLRKSMAQCDFGAVKLLTDIPIKIDGIEVIQIKTIKSKEDYSEFIIRELYKHFDTDYVLITQHDSWVLSADAWDDDFFNYDVIGASWLYIDNRNVSNGGFSLRTKKLQKILATDPMIEIASPEDEIIGRLYRGYLENKYDIKYPSEDVADMFSFELRTPIQPTFGFHGFFHEKFKNTVVIRRSSAMGDVVQVEPVMQYFHDKGYRVVLETLPQFRLLFINHYFKVHSPQEIDGRLLTNAKVCNLDMSYESNPKQLHLKSYFEYAGVPEEEYSPYLKNPTLSLGFPLNRETKLFAKYVVLHVDNRPITQGRNIYGVDWELIVSLLNEMGYVAIQVGKDDSSVIPNAVRINCTNENFLSYVVGGADLMVGIDSGVAAIAVAFKVACVIGFGSVNPNYIHADLSNIEVVTNHNEEHPFCGLPSCWSESITVEGQECIVEKNDPPCCHFTTEQFIKAIKKICK